MVDPAPGVWNPANIVTMARIALVPIFAWALLAQGSDSVGWRLGATALFAVAAITDRVDGHLARTHGYVTDLGKILDPIADKLLVGTALILLTWPIRELPWWVPTIILAREIGVTAMRFALLHLAVLPASRGGKAKTVTQVVAIGLFLLPLDRMPPAATWLAWAAMGVAMLLTVATGLDYALHGARLVRAARGAPSAP